MVIKKKKGMDLDALRNDYQEAVATMAGGGGGAYWAPRDALSLVRILPDKEEGGLYYRKTGAHFSLIKSKMELCPRVTFDKACPICELVDELRKLETPQAAKLIAAINVRKRFLMNIIAMDKDPSKVMQYLGHVTVQKDLLGIILDEDYGDITDPNTGSNVTIEKMAPGGDVRRTEYTTRAKRKESALPDMKVLDTMPVLDEFLQEKVKSYNELSSLLLGDDAESMGSVDDVLVLYENVIKGQKDALKKEGEETEKGKSEALSDGETIKKKFGNSSSSVKDMKSESKSKKSELKKSELKKNDEAVKSKVKGLFRK